MIVEELLGNCNIFKGDAMLYIYDTMKRDYIPFQPLCDKKVKMYVCGITAYDFCHVGHARASVVFDVIYRYLLYKGYDVVFVKNFTDVDDKIVNRANKEKRNWQEVSQKFIDEYYIDMGTLYIKKPTLEPKASEHIKDMVGFIKKLIEKDYAYVSEGDVYFSVDKFKNYGKLSHKKIEELKIGVRIKPSEKKRNPLDFVLWKKSKEGEPEWESPWGKGRPGWHIECSTMCMHYLGETIDIHGGGEDLIFPHHENEIAQSEALTGKTFVRHWIHNAFVKINKEKMSKSLGNFFTIRDISKKYRGEVLRMFLLLTHYRNPIDFSLQGMEAAEEALNKLYMFLWRVEENLKSPENGLKDKKLEEALNKFKKLFIDALDKDFNTPKAIGEIFILTKEINRYLDKCEDEDKKSDKKYLEAFIGIRNSIEDILGIMNEPAEKWFKGKIDVSLIEQKIKQREEERKKGNFKQADKIRKELLKMGIVLEDTKEGTRWKTTKE
jgi:cysteinyl-tRNA synthetase